MKKNFINTAILIPMIFSLSIAAFAQKAGKSPKKDPVKADTIWLDLAMPNNTSSSQVTNGKSVVIIIKNMLPSGHYSINQTRNLKLLGPLQSPLAPAALPGVAVDPCVNLIKALHDAKTEAEFGPLMEQARVADCPDYKTYLAHSTSGPITIAHLNNETFVLTVTNTDSKATWSLTLNTEDKGQFVTLYGFTYIPFIFSKPHTYYANQLFNSDGAPTGTYKVSQGSSEAVADYAPTVSFHYITKQSGVISHSFTAGLGVGLGNTNSSGIAPVVMAGYSVLYNQTIGLNIGIAGHQLNNLKGKYTSGQTVTTNLESSDLTEKVIRFNPFISVVFRFGSSPFTVKKPTTGDGTGANSPLTVSDPPAEKTDPAAKKADPAVKSGADAAADPSKGPATKTGTDTKTNPATKTGTDTKTNPPTVPATKTGTDTKASPAPAPATKPPR